MASDPNPKSDAQPQGPLPTPLETRAATDSEIRNIVGLVPDALPGLPPPAPAMAESTQRIALDEFAFVPSPRARPQEKTQEFLGPSIRLGGLRECGLFSHLSNEELAKLDAIVQESFETKGTVLAKTGQLMDFFGVLASGKVDVEGIGSENGEHGRGFSFGAEAIVAAVPFPLRVVVLEDCLLLKVARSDLMALLRREQELAVKVLWAIVQQTSEELQELRKLIAGKV